MDIFENSICAVFVSVNLQTVAKSPVCENQAGKIYVMTDPIADMLTRIRNAVMAKQSTVFVPQSNLKWRIAEILSRERWIGGVTRTGTAPKEMIRVELLYDTAGKPVLTHLKRLSTPGRRLYVKHTSIPTVLNRFGIAIVSTPEGLMTDREARKRSLGGELVCEVY